MLHIIFKVIFEILQRFIFGVGGISRWGFFQIYNNLYEEKYSKDLDYYIDDKCIKVDSNGFTIHNKNFFSGIIAFVIILLIIEKFE